MNRDRIAQLITFAACVAVGVVMYAHANETFAGGEANLSHAAVIESKEDFNAALENNIGWAFVYCDIDASDAVTLDGVDGENAFAKSVTLEWRSSHYGGYWADVAGSERKCAAVSIFGHEFPSDRINWDFAPQIGEALSSDGTKVQYYKADVSQTGTLYTKFARGTISESSRFYPNETPDEILGAQMRKFSKARVVFWCLWAFVTLVCVCVVPDAIPPRRSAE